MNVWTKRSETQFWKNFFQTCNCAKNAHMIFNKWKFEAWGSFKVRQLVKIFRKDVSEEKKRLDLYQSMISLKMHHTNVWSFKNVSKLSFCFCCMWKSASHAHTQHILLPLCLLSYPPYVIRHWLALAALTGC